MTVEEFWGYLSCLEFPWSIRKVGNEYWIGVQRGAYDLMTIKHKDISVAVQKAVELEKK